jgi:hypothetical protein
MANVLSPDYFFVYASGILKGCIIRCLYHSQILDLAVNFLLETNTTAYSARYQCQLKCIYDSQILDQVEYFSSDQRSSLFGWKIIAK